MDVRPYQSADRDACRALLGAPGFAPDCPYFVMEHDGAIIGCGGYRIDIAHKQATLLWGVIGVQWRKMGLGRFLLMYRLREIGKVDGIERVAVETSPEFAPFFEKQGFKVVRAADNQVAMIKRLIVCA